MEVFVEVKVRVKVISINQYISLLRNLPKCFIEKKHFKDNSNSMIGEVKHKPMRFSLDKK